jgi:hypothetical protein
VTLHTFLRAVTQQVRKYGRKGIEPIERPRELRTGFRTPDGEWLIGVNMIREAFSDDDVVARYRAALKRAVLKGEDRA